MDIDWLENVEDNLTDEWKEYKEVMQKYKELFDVADYTSENVDIKELTRKLKKCIELNIPYSQLYYNE